MIPCLFKAPIETSSCSSSVEVSKRRFEQRAGLSFTYAKICPLDAKAPFAWPFESFSQIAFVISGRLSISIPDTGVISVGVGEYVTLSLKDWQANCRLEGTVELGVLECSSEIWESLTSETEALAHAKKACFGCVQRSEAILVRNKIEPRIFETVAQMASIKGTTPSECLKVESGTLDLLVYASDSRSLTESPAPEPCLRDENEDALMAAAQFLEENLSEGHSLTALSRRVRINEFKLKKGFREQFNTTVFGYLRQKRMERARELLSRNEWTVLEVANAVGYSNPSHFTRAFRETFGQNPKQFTAGLKA